MRSGLAEAIINLMTVVIQLIAKLLEHWQG
jgi:hypothetical protein